MYNKIELDNEIILQLIKNNIKLLQTQPFQLFHYNKKTFLKKILKIMNKIFQTNIKSEFLNKNEMDIILDNYHKIYQTFYQLQIKN